MKTGHVSKENPQSDFTSIRTKQVQSTARKNIAPVRAKSKTAGGNKTVGKKARSWEEKWVRVLTKLEATLGKDVFDTWLKSVKFETVSGGVVQLSVPTRFLKNWVVAKYGDDILTHLQEEDDGVLRIDVAMRSAIRREVVEKKRLENEEKNPSEKKIPNQPNGMKNGMTAGKNGSGRQSEQNYSFAGSPLDPNHTFAAFIEGQSNRMVHAAARTVAESPSGSIGFNPLIIHANVGRGKTHLLQAIAWEARARNPKTRVMYLTAEYFMFLFASAIRDKTALKLKESLRGIDILLIDDMQFLQGKSIQAEFCHLLNELIDSARQVVVAADRPPSELESLDERVRSRLKGGATLEIAAPDYELRKDILYALYERMQVEQPGMTIPEDVLHYIARKVTTSGRDLEGAFNQLVLQHRFSDQNVSLEEIDQTLQHLIEAADTKRIRIEDIQKVVAKQFNVSKTELLSDRRNRSIVRPRQIAMFLSKMMTTRSLPEIGRRFGGRDHTTVLHAVRKVEELTAMDDKLAREVELLKRLILD